MAECVERLWEPAGMACAATLAAPLGRQPIPRAALLGPWPTCVVSEAHALQCPATSHPAITGHLQTHPPTHLCSPQSPCPCLWGAAWLQEAWQCPAADRSGADEGHSCQHYRVPGHPATAPLARLLCCRLQPGGLMSCAHPSTLPSARKPCPSAHLILAARPLHSTHSVTHSVIEQRCSSTNERC